MRLRVLLLLMTVFCNLSFAKSKVRCSAEELKIQNCHIKSKNYELTLLKEHIRVYDKVRRNVVDFPIKDVAQWHKIQLKHVADRTLLEVYAWSKPFSEVGLQNLHWSFLELINEKSKVVLDKVIQKRKLNTQKSTGDYILDPILTHSIKPLKGRKIHWSAGRFSGLF